MAARKPTRFLEPSLYRKLLRRAAAFVESLRSEPEFGQAFNADLRGVRADILRAIRSQLTLRRGRHRDPRLDRACELLSQGKSAPEVLRLQIRRFESLDPYTRYLLGKGLRQAARRRKRSKHSQESSAQMPRQKDAAQLDEQMES